MSYRRRVYNSCFSNLFEWYSVAVSKKEVSLHHPLVQLAFDLCAIDGTTGKEKRLYRFFRGLFDQSWLEKQKGKPVGPEEGRDNLWAFFSGSKSGRYFYNACRYRSSLHSSQSFS